MRDTKKVLVIGDAMVDIYHIGHCTRRSAEVDIPVIDIDTTLSMPGGAMNVIANLRELGVEVLDSTNHGPKKHRLMLGETQIARWDEDDFCHSTMYYGGNDPITVRSYPVIISDYSKGSITPSVIESLHAFAGPFFIDTKRDPSDFAGLLGESYFFPNESEFLRYQHVYSQLANVIHKQGPMGMQYLQYGTCVAKFNALCASPVCTCGAGDAVLVAFTKRYLETGSATQALAYANAAAAVVVSKPFTAVASEAEIGEYLKLYEY